MHRLDRELILGADVFHVSRRQKRKKKSKPAKL